jgi:hypothetical protein
MDNMNSFASIELKSLNLTNGHVGTFNVSIESAIEVRKGDKLFITVPASMSVANTVTCAPGELGIVEVSCISLGNTVKATFVNITQALGTF